MRQTYMVIDGRRYEQGAVFVVKWHDGIALTERRTLFYDYDTESNRYTFITPTYANADHCTSYPDTRFMGNLIRIDTPTEKDFLSDPKFITFSCGSLFSPTIQIL